MSPFMVTNVLPFRNSRAFQMPPPVPSMIGSIVKSMRPVLPPQSVRDFRMRFGCVWRFMTNDLIPDRRRNSML